jgi:hypothetical protein
LSKGGCSADPNYWPKSGGTQCSRCCNAAAC